MNSSLEQIVAAVRRRISEESRVARHLICEKRAGQHQPRGFRRRLIDAARTGPAIIAELKKASPSKGLIRADFRPADLARELESSGAAALSVLTDEAFFQGSLRNLEVASSSTSLPCLRKDFIVDESQIPEARAHGADAILLIVAALSQEELVRLARRAAEYQLDVLCEAHDESELQRALDAGCDLVGVNARDLRTFSVDLQTVLRLAGKIPPGVLGVAESGIRSGNDISRLWSAGYRAFLVGESLMIASRPGDALRELLAQSAAPNSERHAP
jgi:indole-3-glycerol phosphate synthase